MEKIVDTEENAKKEETEKQDTKQEEKEAVEETIKTELYLIDKNGYVVPQTLEFTKNNFYRYTSIGIFSEGWTCYGNVTKWFPSGYSC